MSVYWILNNLRLLYAMSHLSYQEGQQVHLLLQNSLVFHLISSVIHILHRELLLDMLCYPFSVLSTHLKWISPVSLKLLMWMYYPVVLLRFLFSRYPMYVSSDSNHLLWYFPVQISQYPRLPDLVWYQARTIFLSFLMSVPSAVQNDLAVLIIPERLSFSLWSDHIHFLRSVLLMNRILWKVVPISSRGPSHFLPLSLIPFPHLQSFSVINECLILILKHPVYSCGTGSNPVLLFWS